jgi:hypothetical protein
LENQSHAANGLCVSVIGATTMRNR